MAGEYKDITYFFPEGMREAWKNSGLEMDNIQEIRIRVDKRVYVRTTTDELGMPFSYNGRELEDIFRYMCNDSVYAYEEERKQGYITLSGGHRVGLAGELVRGTDGRYIIKYIRYMNIRIAHEIKDVSLNIIPNLYDTKSKQPLNTLVVSPPGVGKTTLLRDIIRLLSNGNECGRGCNVGVVDERGEISGAYMGSATLDCGECTDIITGGDKTGGISVLVRAFSPRVVAIDEIGNQNDAQAIQMACVSGCSILATAHGRGLQDIQQKRELISLIEGKVFERIITLEAGEGGERFFMIYDGEGREVCGRKQLQACW